MKQLIFAASFFLMILLSLAQTDSIRPSIILEIFFSFGNGFIEGQKALLYGSGLSTSGAIVGLIVGATVKRNLSSMEKEVFVICRVI